jgi:ABC-type uncharacterized transport system substrate-binding protein
MGWTGSTGLHGSLPGLRGVGDVVSADTRSNLMSSMTSETGNITGTADKDYNLLWYTQACLDNAMRLDLYIQDAERAGDNEVAELFRKAQADSRKGAEQGKMMLKSRLGG